MDDDAERFRKADAIFDAALDLPIAERGAYLDRACAGDPELRRLVTRLLSQAETPEMLATGGALDALDPDLTGSTIGRYRVLREIGRGGMGVVYEGRDDTLDRSVAIKVLSVPLLDDRMRQRFLREARALAALNHPNVVAIHDAGEAGGSPYLVMEHVEGQSLQAQPPQTLEAALYAATEICSALDHAHARGLVHRDLKPANVLIAGHEEPGTIKLTDLGIALARGLARVTQPGAVAGTPTYMAPEQALGREVDGRADLYSLGVMLYRWLTDRLPFDGDDGLAIVSQHIHAPVVPPRAYRPDLPAALEAVVMRLLAKEPARRFASAAAVRDALEAAARADGAAAAPTRLTLDGLSRGRLVGRREPLARLLEAWRGARDGTAGMVLISGEPGVGKTRLARELMARARLDGAEVLAGGCYEHEATTPYLPYVEALRRVARDAPDERLTAWVGDAAEELARLAPEIETRVGAPGTRSQLSPQEERLRLFDGVARFLRRAAARCGLLVFLDDLQWADHGSLALTHYLLRHLESARILFLGTYREVDLSRAHPLSKSLVDWTRERLAERVRLDRLDRKETARMVETLLNQSDLSEPLLASLHRETEGNPFFIEETLKALIASGELVRQETSWQRRSSGSLVVPQSVKAAIGSRIDRVGDTCVETLRTAAVLGKSFEFAELAGVAGRPEDELLDALDEAVSAQLLASGPGESFSFTHDKIREVLYEELNPIRRRRLHSRIAEGLEALAREYPVRVEELAHHFVAGGDCERGQRYAREAAQEARKVYAHDEALEMLAHARECAETLGRVDDVPVIDEELGDTALAGGKILLAAEHYERSLAAVADPERRNALRCKAAEAYVTAGDPRGLELVKLARGELNTEKQQPLAATAMMLEARYHHIAGRLEKAVELLGPAVELAEAAGDDDLLVRALSYLSGTLQHQADFESSDRLASRCVEIGEERGIHSGVMLGHEFLSENAFYQGRFADAVRHGELEEALARKTHSGERLAWSLFRANALHAMGRLTEAETLFREGIRHCTRQGERRLHLFLVAGLAACHADLGRSKEALTVGRRAIRESDEADLISQRITARGLWIYSALTARAPEGVVEQARAAVELWRGSDSRGVGMIYGTWLAEGLLAGGAWDEAEEVLASHRSIAEATASEQRIGQNLRVGGLLARRQGRKERAHELLDEAVLRLSACESPLDLIRALVARGAEGDRPRAERLVQECGATRGLFG